MGPLFGAPSAALAALALLLPAAAERIRTVHLDAEAPTAEQRTAPDGPGAGNLQANPEHLTAKAGTVRVQVELEPCDDEERREVAAEEDESQGSTAKKCFKLRPREKDFDWLSDEGDSMPSKDPSEQKPGTQTRVRQEAENWFEPVGENGSEAEAMAKNAVFLQPHEVASALMGTNRTAVDLIDRGDVYFRDWECERIERMQFLRQFGLSGFAGCHSETNFGRGAVCKSNNVLWLYPINDHNNAFCIENNVCHRLTVWNQQACSVQVRRVASVNEALSALNAYPDESIKHVVLGGHGSGTYLVWGQSPEGYMGVRANGTAGQDVVQGVIVRVERAIVASQNVRLPVGAKGYVILVDYLGDVLLQTFGLRGPDGSNGHHWVRRLDKDKLRVMHSPSGGFLQKLGQKMQQHASIFMDSCLSASPKRNPNLAQYVSQVVGKGIRVIGSRYSFGKVRVVRFYAWHAQIKTSMDDNAQQVYNNQEARCPPWARGHRPDSAGNCACPRFQTCRTDGNRPCPAAGGSFSERHFMPFCAESWAEEKCMCESAACLYQPSARLLWAVAVSLLLALH